MTDRPAKPSSYWSQLDAAEAALGGADYAAAESLFQVATRLREASPGRVFLTEKLGDRLQRMLKRRDGEQDRDPEIGRWRLRTEAFTNRFLAQGEHVVREALRLAELRPEDEAEANQPVLERALYLVTRSRLFPAEPRSAVPLFKGLVRTACRTGRPFDVHLVRHDLPLTEEERLWLAAKGGDMLEAFVELGHLEPGSVLAGEWARSILQILQQQYFGSVGRLEGERAWLEAVTADRLLDRPAACVALYRQYLAINPMPGPRPDEARVRILEILANTPDLHLGVPRYGEALAALQAAGLAPGSAVADRYQRALACIEHRRPRGEDLAWATVGAEADGTLAVVFWWDREPRDVAFWRPGEETAPLDAFLEPCRGRILAADAAAVAAAGTNWAAAPHLRSADQFALALLEPVIGAKGPDPEVRLGWAMAEVGAWRAGWSGPLTHPALAPPADSLAKEQWRDRRAAAALLAGLDLLAIASRLAAADPSLRAGIAELARRGDGAAAELYALVTLGRDADLALDSSFEPWTLPLLWTRPDPLGGQEETEPQVGVQSGLRPDLGRNDLAIVSSGSPAAVMAAWGDSRAKWRVVLDRAQRRDALGKVAHGVLGPVTLVPPGGRVHALGPALAALDELLGPGADPADRTGGLLGLFHWQRLVETHNGDLLDFLEIRPRRTCDIDIYEDYREFVAGLPGEAVGTPGTAPDGWAGQYAQRARKSGLVVGAAADLPAAAPVLDALWGVFEGSDASWVFLDSAAVHVRLLEQGDAWVGDLHGLLHARGRRHLSLLTGSVWLRSAVEDLLQDILAVYGRASCLALTDLNTPLLKLADQGLRPDAFGQEAAALGAQFRWLAGGPLPEPVTVAVPSAGLARRFWQAVAAGRFGGAPGGAQFLERVGETSPPAAQLDSGTLVLPTLPGLQPERWAGPVAATAEQWQRADAAKGDVLAEQIRRSALTLAGLLSGSWTEVVVLDVRWWHMLRGHGTGPPEPGTPAAAGTWSAASALAVAGAAGARLFGLPEPEDPPADKATAALQAEIRRWAAAEGAVAGPAVPAVATPAATHPVTLHLGPASEVWSVQAAVVAGARDRGRLESWLLVVAESVPESWRALVDHDPVRGDSIWAPDGQTDLRAAVTWVGPSAFRGKGFLEEIRSRPPAAVLVTELQSALPGAGDERHETAVALRALLEGVAAPVILQAEGLADPWLEFFSAVLGARLVKSGRAGVAEPGAAELPPTTVPETPEEKALARPAARTHRLRRLLTMLRPTLVADRKANEGGGQLASPNELVSAAWLGRLAGLAPQEVVRGVRVLRWAVRVSGQPLPAAAVSAEQAPVTGSGRTAGHALLIPRRFAEIQSILERAAEQLGILVPLWLQGLGPGRQTWIDLDNPPARVPAEDLLLLDGLLGSWADGAHPPQGLVFRSGRGVLTSNRRLLGCGGQPEAMLEAMREEIQQFLARVRGVMDTAVETPTGFLVETGLLDLRPEEEEFLALGSTLGFWRWLGPRCRGGYHLVDVLALADGPAVEADHPVWKLWEALLAGGRGSGGAEAEPALRGEGRWGGLRSLLAQGVGHGDDLEEAIAAVGALACDPKPAQLVLRGLAGTGRHLALVRGLVQARDRGPDPAEVTVFCPDTATAAFIAAEYLAEGGGAALEVIVPDRATPLASQPGTGRADPAGSLVVMCEVQRFPAELRYKVAQLGRGRRLITTVDPAATEEAWEHLFLTSPRAEQILEFRQQRRLSRKVWQEVRQLHPEGGRAGSGTRSPVRGEVAAEYAANLDQCVGLLAGRATPGAPPPVLRVTASVPADLEYLGAALRDRGWLAEPEAALDSLLLPGAREMLAALADLLTVTGDLRPPPAEAETPGEATLLLPLLAGTGCAEAWAAWGADHGPEFRERPLGEIILQLARLPWLAGTLAHAPARSTLGPLGERWGGVPLKELAADGMFGIWRLVLGRRLDLADPDGVRPVALLAPADRLPGSWAAEGVQLCLGSEPPGFHYGIWSRIEQKLLILYQEQSPLPGAAGR